MVNLDDQMYICIHDLYEELTKTNADPALKTQVEDCLIEFSIGNIMNSHSVSFKGREYDSYQADTVQPQQKKALDLITDVVKQAGANQKISAQMREKCRETAEARAAALV
jgi:hypothetical protein